MNAPAIAVVRLYLSPGHNYFGHHGQPAGEHPVIEVEEIECVAGKGIRGDRFFDYKPDYKGQVTLFAWEVYEEARAHFGVGMEPGPEAFRRNVITRGADLNGLIGKEFEIQGVRLSGSAECAPCHWMDQAFAPGAEEFLKGHGGLRCRILESGVIRRG